MSTLIILQQMAVIAILVGVGIMLYKRGMVDDATSKRLSAIVIDVCNPALVMSCVLTGEIKATHKELLTAVGVAVIIYSLLCVLGILIPKLIRVPDIEQKYYNLMTVYTNVGFIGIPVGKAVLSDTGMLYVIVFNVMFCLFFYTHGIQVLGGKKEKIKLSKLFSPGTIMSLLTLVVFWFDISLPDVLGNSIVYLGNATVFLSMSLLGISLAKAAFQEALKEKSIWSYILVRMLLLPILLAYVLRALHFSEDMVQAFCLMVSMPVANLPLIQAEKTGENTQILSRGIMVTTVVSFVTITIVMSVVFSRS